jgi:XTP/dITP diphosphohydrolase
LIQHDLVVATRSDHKLREIRELTAAVPDAHLLSLSDLAIPPDPREDEIEAFFTFEENALAKARYFVELTTRAVLADDSGLCVDALGGAPGVLSKRFSGRSDLSGDQLDQANNEKLLADLHDVPPDRRTAHYVCVVAFVTPQGTEDLFRGTVDGLILEARRGSGGFGYDPLFFVPDLNATFAEVLPEFKNRLSHRARALDEAIPRLRSWLSDAT